MASKRHLDDNSSHSGVKHTKLTNAKPECLFGPKCYRQNPHHFREYSHPHLLRFCLKPDPTYSPTDSDDVDKDVFLNQVQVFKDICKSEFEEAKRDKGSSPTVSKERSLNNSKVSLIQKKLQSAQPLSYFLTKVKDSPATHQDLKSIYFAELLHPSLGKLKRSLQVNFMVEWDWLKMNYELSQTEDKPLLIIHGEENPNLAASKLPGHVRAIRVKPRFPFGTHHTKLMVFQYEDDSVRIVVSTANLVGSDWENRTQGLWVGPRCSKLSQKEVDEKVADDSRTGFKASLLRYLRFYELTPLKSYIDAIKSCNFSDVNVFFLGSVPNSHKGPDLNAWGLRQLASLLRKHVPEETKNWPIILQCSSIGSLGPTSDSWLRDQVGRTLASHQGMGQPRVPAMSLIYPSKRNVESSYDNLLGGACLPYSRKTHQKQPWLESYLNQWKSDANHRSRAMPHIKTYTKVNEENTKAAYFVLTSSNLSKAAWGILSKGMDSQQIQSYEGGVLFLPEFVTGEKYFRLGKDLQLPYDLPLQKYEPQDSCWFMDYLQESLR